MAGSSSSNATPPDKFEEDEDNMMVYGGGSGWVEPKTSCDHLGTLSSDLLHISPPDTACFTCHHRAENWLCLCCKDVFCSRFINKHMLHHYQEKGHCLALSYSDLSVWCFTCDAYLDAQVIAQLRPAYETAYILKFAEAPPVRTVSFMQLDNTAADSSSS